MRGFDVPAFFAAATAGAVQPEQDRQATAEEEEEEEEEQKQEQEQEQEQEEAMVETTPQSEEETPTLVTQRLSTPRETGGEQKAAQATAPAPWLTRA